MHKFSEMHSFLHLAGILAALTICKNSGGKTLKHVNLFWLQYRTTGWIWGDTANRLR